VGVVFRYVNEQTDMTALIFTFRNFTTGLKMIRAVHPLPSYRHLRIETALNSNEVTNKYILCHINESRHFKSLRLHLM
jgi:hypothetical protein